MPTMLVVYLVLIGCLLGCDSSEIRHGQHPSVIDGLIARKLAVEPDSLAREKGRLIYQHYCQICHGELGEGNGFNASLLSQTPRDFTQEEYWATAKQDAVIEVISNGGEAVGKSLLMPAWGNTLSASQIQDVARFLKSFPGLAKDQENSESTDWEEDR